MRTAAIRLLVCGVLLVGVGCGEDDEPGSPGGNTAGSGGGSGTGGRTGSGGGTGGASVGTGGSGTGGAVSSGGSSGAGGSAGGAGGTGGRMGSGGAGGASASDAGGETGPAPDGGGAAPVPGEGPYGCTKCTPIFDGKTLDGWEHRGAADAWLVKDGALASNGKPNDIWTKEDFGSFRIFFKVRQVMGNHKPDVIFFGTRPAPGAQPRRGLGGAQFQPPNGGSWDYGAGGTFMRPMNPMWNANNWHQCEVLVKEAGSFRAACCPVAATPCKGIEVLRWTGKGKKAPFGIQMHNPGLFDEYKDIMVERDPAVDDLLMTK